MNVFALIQSDIRAKARWLYGDAGWRSRVKARLTDGSLAMQLYRLMQASHRLGLAPLAMLFNKLNVICGGCVIGRGADFGPEFVLVHSQGVVINAAVRGGRHVVLEHQVTIGSEKGLAPVLGDDVFVGAGAKIIGGVRVGRGTRIGANAVVISDVPDGATAVGVPARMVVVGRPQTADHRPQTADGRPQAAGE
jgi:serine O-acetyltransferase